MKPTVTAQMDSDLMKSFGSPGLRFAAFCFSVIILTLVPSNSSFAQQSFAEKMDAYLLEMELLPAEYSFDVVAELVTSVPAENRVSIREEVGRVSVSKTNKVRRHHARVSIGAGAMAEHWFQTDQMRYSFSGLGNTGGLQEAKLTPGRNLFSIYQMKTLPFAVPVDLKLGCDERKVFDEILTAKVLKEETSKDGVVIKTILFQSGVGAARIHYSRDPTWLPETIEFISGTSTTPINVSNATLEDISEWKVRGATKTNWKKHRFEDNEFWLPYKMSMTMEMWWDGRAEMVEARFGNWQFEDQIPASTFELEKFKAREDFISDFSAIRDSLERELAESQEPN